MIWLLLACGGPSRPAPASPGTPAAQSLQQLVEAGEDAREVRASSERMQALLEDLRNAQRNPDVDQEALLRELAEELERARAANEALDEHLDAAEAALGG